MTRSTLRGICRALIGMVLLAQLCIAAYACPRLVAPAAPAHMPDCPGMAAMADQDQEPQLANLCAEHCRFGDQSDQTATLAVPAGLLTARYVVEPAPAAAALEPRAAPAPEPAASPPHAIAHCCWRI